MIALLKLRELRHKAIRILAEAPQLRNKNPSPESVLSMTPEVILSHLSPNYVLTLTLKAIKVCSKARFTSVSWRVDCIHSLEW